MKPYILFLPRDQESAVVSSCLLELFRRSGGGELPLRVTKLSQLRSCGEGEEPIRLLVCDVTVPGVIPVLEQLRRGNSDMKLILVADGTISPVHYIKPGVLPTSLLWRPMDETNTLATLEEVLSSLAGGQPEESGEDDCFTVEMRGTVKRYEYREILFFEAREKRLVLHLQRRELPFPGTLEKLTEVLPDTFLRVHKSFIVNKTRVREIQYGQSMLILDGGEQIPISRTYKASVKAVFA